MKIEGMAASISPIDAQGFTPVQLALGVKFSGFGEAAASWFKFGFEVIPIVPNTMQPAVPVDAWRDGLSSKAIWEHWSKYPDHEIGFVLGDEMIVIETESREANDALNKIERSLDAWPNVTVNTPTGWQSYFRRMKGTYAESDARGKSTPPTHISIKAVGAIEFLPPSTGRTLSHVQADTAGELIEIGQDFIDAIFERNGRLPPRAAASERVDLEHEPTRLIEPKVGINSLDPFSLIGKTDEIEKQAVAAIPILGQVALQGQSTVFYAAPNTGKTLIVLWLLIEAIQQCRVHPSYVYYLDMDDNSTGLVEKARLGDEYGFNILAQGYRAFSAEQFHSRLQEMIDLGQARGVIVILDTLKKFVDLMHKAQTSSLTRIIRSFVLKGGTLIALAHTNKNLGRDGKPQYGGVSDILNDFDCAYILTPIAPEAGCLEKIVEFENIKLRGNVVQTAAYRYSVEQGISYNDLILSVRPVDAENLVPLKQAEQSRSDAELIGAVTACIKAGLNTKMKLTVAAAERAGVSRKTAGQIIEKYTGEDSVAHRWKFTVQGRGAKVFVLLDSSVPGPKL